MNDHPISILSTRPIAHTVMIKAKDENIEIDFASFIETKNNIDERVAKGILKYVTDEIAVVFTSMNAAEAVIDFLKAIDATPAWLIYTLGGVTGTITKGFFTESEIFSSSVNSTQLAKTIISNDEKQVVFFCGNQRRDELPELLKAKNIQVDELVVYETIETPVHVEKSYEGILFFSPSAVRSFFSVNKIDADTVLFAIGTTTADELAGCSKNKILVGSQPNKELLALQAISYLKSNLPQKDQAKAQ